MNLSVLGLDDIGVSAVEHTLHEFGLGEFDSIHDEDLLSATPNHGVCLRTLWPTKYSK